MKNSKCFKTEREAEIKRKKFKKYKNTKNYRWVTQGNCLVRIKNKMTNISCEKIRAFISDEEKGIRDYKESGLNRLAKDETRHRDFLKKLERQKCK